MKLTLTCAWPGHADNSHLPGWSDEPLVELTNVREYTSAPRAYCHACTPIRDAHEAILPPSEYERVTAELTAMKVKLAQLETALAATVAAELEK